MARITAKARVGSNITVDANQHEVRFYPVLEYRMVVKNAEVAALFPIGKSFTVTFDDGE